MSTIKIDYNTALASAKKLENAAQKCGEVASKAHQTYAPQIENSWKGASGTQACESLLEWENDVKASQQELARVAQQIRQVVSQMQEADRRAAAANTGSSGGGYSGGGGRSG